MTDPVTDQVPGRHFPRGALLVAVALLAGALIGGKQTRAEAPLSADLVEVVGATAVCPDLRQVEGTLATRVSIGVAPLPDGRTSTGGTVEALRVSARGTPEPVGVSEPGQVSVGLGTSTDKDGLVVTASKALAAGLEVEQVTRGEAGIDRGLAGLRCEAPRTDAWFVGGATMIGDTTVLVLANVDDTPATVDVTTYAADSPDGPPDPRLGQGLTVAPHTRQIISMDTLAPDRNQLAVHVSSRRGRVAAGLRYGKLDGTVPQGVDWVPISTAPSSRVVVPGMPQGPGTRALLLANPGQDDVVASIRVATVDGQFVPTGLDAVDVPAGQTTTVRIDNLVKDSALTAEITSTGGPIVAGGFVQDRQTGGIREFAFTGGSTPLSGPALLTDLVIDRPTESTLILSALDGPASVVIRPIRVVGTKGELPTARRVQIPAGRTVTFKLSTFYPPGTETRLAVQVRPDDTSGLVYAARYLRERGARGPLSTLLDLQGPAQLVVRPEVVEDRSLGS